MSILDPLTLELKGRKLIEASAGTGKTYTITTLFLRLLLEIPMRVNQILVVTFTEAAAGELKDRIRARMAEALSAYRTGRFEDPLFAHLFSRDRAIRARRLIEALREFDSAEIATIHGFLNHVLSEHAFECGVSFDATLVTDQTELYREVVYDFYAAETASASPLFLTYLEAGGHGPEMLSEVMAQAFRTKDAAVIPDAAPAIDPSPEFETAFQRAKAAFAADGEGFESLLDNHKGINRRVYSKRYLPVWFETLSRYLQAEVAELPLPAAVARFTSQSLGIPASEHAVLFEIDALVDAAGGFEQAVVAMKRRFLDSAEQALDRLKQQQNVLTFDDLIHRVDDALSSDRGAQLQKSIRERLGSVLIDEFQDTDPAQYRIFNTLFGSGDTPFILIGDPKQSIYGFRGADIFTYLKAAGEAGDARFTLPRNWRSDPGLIQAVNTVFSRVPAPFFFEDIQFHPVSPRDGVADAFPRDCHRAPLEIRFVERERFGIVNPKKPITKGVASERLPELVAADIGALLDDTDLNGRPVTPSRVAVLVSTNQQAEEIRAALARVGIKGLLFSAASVFHADAAEELLLVMRAVDDPGNPGKLRTALATRIIGMDAGAVLDLESTPVALESWVAQMTGLRRTWDEQGFIVMWRRLLDERPHGSSETTIGAAILQLRDGERIMTDLRHLAELLEQRRSETGCGRRALMQWFIARKNADTGSVEEAELRLESDEESVRIITVHKAKGLEFDIVYCPYLHDGLSARRAGALYFHHPEKARRPYLDLGSPDEAQHRRFVEAEEMAENLRLAYVALTRARYKVVMVHGAFHNMATSPLSYLIHRSSPAMSVAELKAEVGKMSDEALSADLDRLLDDARGTIVRAGFRQGAGQREAAPAISRSLLCREMRRPILPPCLTTSFTGLVESDVSLLAGDLHEEPFDESDPVDWGAPTFDEHDRIDSDGAASRSSESARSQLALGFKDDPMGGRPESSLPLVDFERGAVPGTLLHLVFEKMDFSVTDSVVNRHLVEEILHQFGYELWWAGPIVDMAERVCRTVLPGAPGLCLQMLSKTDRLNEFGFVFPMAHGCEVLDGLFTEMAALLKAEGAPIPEGYDQGLARLERPLQAGFLKGFIDLVFTFQGRYYIVDYKSNHLGDAATDYGRSELEHAMAEHHYFVQYHLYTVALHRFLATRVPDYAFDTHFGGVYYLFLRGISGESTADHLGVFYDKPSAALIDALSALFEGCALKPGNDGGGG